MVQNGILPETNRFELIDGRIEEKQAKGPEHRTSTERTRRAIDRLLPPGWHTCQEAPVRIANRRSEPEPDVSVVRGGIDDYSARHPGPADIALVVEVTRSSATKDRELARVYGGGGIPAYWIVNIPERRLEVYKGPIKGQYPHPTILEETETVDLVIGRKVVGRIRVSDLLLKRP
jgi:Uma2 family endonuclease